MKQIIIGIDIGGTNTRLGSIDAQGTILSETSFNTQSYNNAEDYFRALVKNLQQLLFEQIGKVELKGIGIGAPGVNSKNGTIESAVNFNWNEKLNLKKFLQSCYNVPVKITNDANAATLGELKFGAAKNMTDFVLITLGTGLGAGIVANGNLINGHNSFSGELGHMVIEENGRSCKCGRKGCLETYVSATGLETTFRELIAFNPGSHSKLKSIKQEDITSKLIAEAALENEYLAKQAFEYTGKILGKKLADIVTFSDPEAIFLAGGLANSGDLIFEPTKRYLQENVLGMYKEVKLLPSGLSEDDVTILGAAALVTDGISKDRRSNVLSM